MEKWAGLSVGEWEIVDKVDNNDHEYEYEEISVEELLDRESYSKEDKLQFIKKYSAVNIHQLLSKETYNSCLRLLDDVGTDPRLDGLNAVVFLMLKPKGDRNKFSGIESVDQFKKLVETAQSKNISIGMDSCSAPLMLKTASELGQEELIPSIEPCESTLFSIYINVLGEVFPCSFSEDTTGWQNGIQMKEVNSFVEDVWFSEKLKGWRSELTSLTSGCTNCTIQSHCRACPIYDITPCLEVPHPTSKVLPIIYT